MQNYLGTKQGLGGCLLLPHQWRRETGEAPQLSVSNRGPAAGGEGPVRRPPCLSPFHHYSNRSSSRFTGRREREGKGKPRRSLSSLAVAGSAEAAAPLPLLRPSRAAAAAACGPPASLLPASLCSALLCLLPSLPHQHRGKTFFKNHSHLALASPAATAHTPSHHLPLRIHTHTHSVAYVSTVTRGGGTRAVGW